MEKASHQDEGTLRKGTYNLVDMLARVTAENIHSETATEPAQGNEEW